MSDSSANSANAARQPQTPEEWTVQALNTHGTFFERWCELTIAQAHPWQVRFTNYPVELPPFAPQRGHGQESALDVRAERVLGDSRLTLVIECKRNNPDFIDWVFIPLSSVTHARMSHITRFGGPPDFAQRLAPLDLPMPTVTDARETRGTYQGQKKGDFTKTSTTAIWDASRQVALATQVLIFEESQLLATAGDNPMSAPSPYRAHAFLPVIVTTARILTCGFDPADVDTRTGEISFDKTNLGTTPLNRGGRVMVTGTGRMRHAEASRV